MKVLLNGNVVTIATNVPFEDLKKVHFVHIPDTEDPKAPGYTAQVISLAAAEGCFCDTGICFEYANKDGNACLNLISDGEYPTKEQLIETFGNALLALEENEEKVVEAVKEQIALRNRLAETITQA